MDPEEDRVATVFVRLLEVGRRLHRLAVHADDHVTRTNAGARRRRSPPYVRHDDARLDAVGDLEPPPELASERLEADASERPLILVDVHRLLARRAERRTLRGNFALVRALTEAPPEDAPRLSS